MAGRSALENYVLAHFHNEVDQMARRIAQSYGLTMRLEMPDLQPQGAVTAVGVAFVVGGNNGSAVPALAAPTVLDEVKQNGRATRGRKPRQQENPSKRAYRRRNANQKATPEPKRATTAGDKFSWRAVEDRVLASIAAARRVCSPREIAAFLVKDKIVPSWAVEGVKLNSFLGILLKEGKLARVGHAQYSVPPSRGSGRSVRGKRGTATDEDDEGGGIDDLHDDTEDDLSNEDDSGGDEEVDAGDDADEDNEEIDEEAEKELARITLECAWAVGSDGKHFSAAEVYREMEALSQEADSGLHRVPSAEEVCEILCEAKVAYLKPVSIGAGAASRFKIST